MVGRQVVQDTGQLVADAVLLGRVLRERVVEVDHRLLHGGERAAGHQVRHPAQDVLDIVGRRGIAQRDGVAVLQRHGCRVVRGQQRDVDVAQDGPLPQLGTRVLRQLDAPGDIDVGDRGTAVQLHPV